MLNYGRIIGQLPKLATCSHANRFCGHSKYIGIFSINNLWYSSKTTNKKPYKPSGTTIKPEECIPKSTYSKSQRTVPACESYPNASCPPSCYEVCGKANDSQDPNNKPPSLPPYWKIVATIVIAGVTIYMISSINDWFSPKKKGSQKDMSGSASKRHRKLLDKIKVPATSSSFPQEVPYLLIGGGTAAFSAFRAIKSIDPTAKVLIVTDEGDLPYMRPPLSKELWYNRDKETGEDLVFKQWNGTSRSIFFEPPEFYLEVNNLIKSEKGGVALANGWRITKIDVPKKTVTLDDGYQIKYEKCLIATGASPKNLPVFESIPDELKDTIRTFRTKEDFLDLEDSVQNPKCKNIVIIGGGFLGTELAFSLVHNLPKDRKVYQVFKEKYLMDQILPQYLSDWATKKAQSEGVNYIPSSEVVDYTYKNGRLSLVLSGNNVIDADQVIVAVGVEPNTDLAKESHLETHPQVGGFLVNAELEARSDLWVAGDASCFYDVKLGRRRVEHHDHAVMSGRLAGENMTGAGKPYLHQPMFWSNLGPEVAITAIGIVDSSLPTVGVFAKIEQPDGSPPTIDTSSETSKSSAEKASLVEVQKFEKQDSKQEESKSIFGEGLKPAIDDNKKYDDFEKGVIFYLRDDIVVGIVLWNTFDRIDIARRVLATGTKYDDLNEVAKLFAIHDD